MRQLLCFAAFSWLFASVSALLPASSNRQNHHLQQIGLGMTAQAPSKVALSAQGNADENDIVAKRIIVKGDVQGGYYRSCVLNEAGRFRRLVGTMSPPDDSDTAEIYVEGKRKMVDGFIRWCKKGNVGLSQVVGIEEVTDEEVTGLYDGFYVKTK